MVTAPRHCTALYCTVQEMVAAPRPAVLGLLTASYLLGELGHFLLSATSRDMARDIGE